MFLLAGWPAVYRSITRGGIFVQFSDKTKYANDHDYDGKKSSTDARDQRGHVTRESQETFVGLGTSAGFWKKRNKIISHIMKIGRVQDGRSGQDAFLLTGT